MAGSLLKSKMLQNGAKCLETLRRALFDPVWLECARNWAKAPAQKIEKPARKNLKLKRLATEAKIAPVPSDEEENTAKTHADDDLDVEEEEFESEDNLHPQAETEDSQMFKAIYSIGYWDNPADNFNRCCSVAILAFSGVDLKSDFSAHVIDNKFLEYSVLWPSEMTSAKQLHSVWLTRKGDRKKIENYHSMVTCFEPKLARMRRHDQRIATTARISLGMHVELRPEVHLLSFPGSSTRIIYVVLRGPARKAANLADDEIAWEQ